MRWRCRSSSTAHAPKGERITRGGGAEQQNRVVPGTSIGDRMLLGKGPIKWGTCTCTYTLQAEVCFGMASDAFPASGGGGARQSSLGTRLGGELLLGAQLQTSVKERTSGGPLNSAVSTVGTVLLTFCPSSLLYVASFPWPKRKKKPQLLVSVPSRSVQ